MDAFSPVAPDWTEDAVHAKPFGCPSCQADSTEARQVWLNRRAPVFTDGRKRKWQEFYLCECGTAWWAWSSDRPPADWQRDEKNTDAFGTERLDGQ